MVAASAKAATEAEATASAAPRANKSEREQRDAQAKRGRGEELGTPQRRHLCHILWIRREAGDGGHRFGSHGNTPLLTGRLAESSRHGCDACARQPAPLQGHARRPLGVAFILPTKSVP